MPIPLSPAFLCASDKVCLWLAVTQLRECAYVTVIDILVRGGRLHRIAQRGELNVARTPREGGEGSVVALSLTGFARVASPRH